MLGLFSAGPGCCILLLCGIGGWYFLWYSKKICLHRYCFQTVLHIGRNSYSLREECITPVADSSYLYSDDPDPKLAQGISADLAMATLSTYENRNLKFCFLAEECPCIVFGSKTPGKYLGLGNTTRAEQDWILEEVNATVTKAKRVNLC